MDIPRVMLEATTLALVVLAFDIWERLRPGYKVDRRRHLKLDLCALAVVIVFGEVWKRVLTGAFEGVHLAALLPPPGVLASLPSAARVAIGLLVADFCLYWVHRAMHASDILWRTHVFHHSVQDLYWLSGARTSVTHLLLFALPQVLLAGYVFRLTPGEAAVAFSIGVLVNVWVHTNLRVNLGPLEWLIITPDYHRVHHSANELSRTNLGFVLTIWDRLFGTYTDPRRIPRPTALGTADPGEHPGRMIVGF